MRSAVLVLAVALAAQAQERPPRPPETAFVGSAACGQCHPDLLERWSKTAHALTLADFSPEVVARPFDGEVFTARDIDHKLGPGPTMECEGPGGELRRFPVEMVIGLRRVQMFTTTMADGRIQVLPVFLEVPRRKWFDYTDFLFGGPAKLEIPPDSPNSWYSWARNFNSRCGACHTTNYDVGYDPDTGWYATTWSERTVGCETCHGPGGGHVRHHEERGKGADPIVNPARLTRERADQVCGQCHAEAEIVVPGFRPGDDLFAFVDPAGLEDDRHLHPDGRAKELIHNLVPAMESRCGPMTCTTCHDPHGRGIPGLLYKPVGNDWTCTQCHAEVAERIEEHTHHPAASEGSRCVGCHMQRLVIEGGHGRVYDHAISVPSVRNTRAYGLPNACAACHLAEPSNWEVPHFERWYPGAEERNHRVALAAAVWGGRGGRPEAQPLLEKLLRDANPVYRAGAARLLAGYDADLRPQLGDPHPMVRRAAIDGVARQHPDALLPLLDDPNGVLRYRAAMALASRADQRERQEIRARLLPVLEAFAVRRTDSDALHFAIARLQELEGRPEDANRTWQRYHRIR